MRFFKFSTLATLIICSLSLIAISGCTKSEPETSDETVEGESDLSAEASFKMDTPSDCVSNFSSRPFLSLIASRRNWGSTEIAAFCDALNSIKTSYATSTTLTVATVAGAAQINGSNIENALYIGAVGYDLTALRTWIQASTGDGHVRRCMRKSRTRKILFGSVPKNFILDCLEDETGVAYPGALFKARLSTTTLSGLGEVGVGGGISVAMLNVPGYGIVVGFLGGAFYVESDPTVGAFLGCGAMAAAVVAGDSAAAGAVSPICIAAAFAETDEGSPPATP